MPRVQTTKITYVTKAVEYANSDDLANIIRPAHEILVRIVSWSSVDSDESAQLLDESAQLRRLVKPLRARIPKAKMSNADSD